MKNVKSIKRPICLTWTYPNIFCGVDALTYWYFCWSLDYESTLCNSFHVYHCTKNEEIFNGKLHFLSSVYMIMRIVILRILSISRCGSKKCKFQLGFYPSSKIASTATKRMFDCILPFGTIDLNCHSANVMYCITCSNCYL